MEMSQLLDLFGIGGTASTASFDRTLWLKAEKESNGPIFIHAADDPAAQILCALWLTKPNVLVASACLKCAYDLWGKKSSEFDTSHEVGYPVLIDGLNKA
jgi:hypothetical protein